LYFTMGLSSLFNCFGCGNSKNTGDVPATKPVFDIEGRDPQKSDESFDSEPETIADDKKVPVVTDFKQIRKNRALVVASKGTYGFTEEAFPEFSETEVVISNHSTGLNPIDYKSVDYNFCLPEFPWITGREMAGVVEAIGSKVTDVKVGDKVWTSTSPPNSRLSRN